MKSIMIVVADSSRARVFTTDSSNSPLHEIETMAHPEGRMHEQDMVSDLPGKGSGQAGAGSHAYQEIVEPKAHEAMVFAKRVAEYLDARRKTGGLARLFIVAAPAFLGDLRNQMSEETSKLVVFDLAKNLTQHSVEDIRSHLPKYLNQ